MVCTKRKADWSHRYRLLNDQVNSENLFDLNSQKHELQCKYQSYYCYYCKHWVIGNDHEGDCPEMPDTCYQCHKNVMRKDLEVILFLLAVYSIFLRFFLLLTTTIYNMCQIGSFFSKERKSGCVTRHDGIWFGLRAVVFGNWNIRQSKNEVIAKALINRSSFRFSF